MHCHRNCYEVSFYRLKADGEFSLAHYRRRDKPADVTRDMPFLEDATYCISKVIASSSVAVPALRKVARYTRDHSSIFVTDGPKSLTPTQKAKRQQEIEALADAIDKLADEAGNGRASYIQFEGILTKLHAAGFFPLMTDLSAVAKTMV